MPTPELGSGCEFCSWHWGIPRWTKSATILASTQRHIGFAVSARDGGMGSTCVAAPRREHGYDNGLAHPWGLHALLFLAMWVGMIAGTTLPTAAPMVLAFHEAEAQHNEQQLDVAFVSTWVFVAAYLLVWALSGIAAYAGVLAAAAVRPALADGIG